MKTEIFHLENPATFPNPVRSFSIQKTGRYEPWIPNHIAGITNKVASMFYLKL